MKLLKQLPVCVVTVVLMLSCMNGVASDAAMGERAAAKTAVTQMSADIHVQGQGPYYRLDLPTSIYLSAAHPNLRDVKITNADGQALLHAWQTDANTESTLLSSEAAIFPVVKNTAQNNGNKSQTESGAESQLYLKEFKLNANGVILNLETKATQPNQTAREWIIDASQIQGSQLQGHVSLVGEAKGFFPFRLDVSDDLQHWQTLSENEQLLNLEFNGHKVQKFDVNLYNNRSHYIRLKWLSEQQDMAIAAVKIDSVKQQMISAPLEWSAIIQASSCTKNSCEYLIPKNTPLEKLRLHLSEVNTLAEISVLGELPAEINNQRRHVNPLYTLRHKRETDPVQEKNARTIFLRETLAYRLQQGAGEVQMDDLDLRGDVLIRLIIKTPVAMSLLGKTPPTIQIGSTPRSLIFLGRGAQPYRLNWGADNQQSFSTSIETLIPGYQPGQVVKADQATVDIPVLLSNQNPLTQKVDATTPQPMKKWWLWVALGAGFLILAAMAWSLFRSMNKPGQNQTPT